MKEKLLQRACNFLTRRTENAYLRGDKEKALKWSRWLDKVIYQLLLIKNYHILQELRGKKL